MYLNTDGGNYITEYLSEGVPASTVRTREFQPDFTTYRNMLIQPYTDTYRKYLMNEKLRIMYKNLPRYHQSRMPENEEVTYKSILSRHVDGSYDSLFEMCMAMPCDLAICRRQESGEYEIDFVHLVFPNGWGADLAIGKNFHYFHKYVEDSNGEHVLPSSNKFPEHFAKSGKVYERVGAFSLRSSSRLDRHPNDMDETIFDNNCEGVFIRFERQVVYSVPDQDAFMFFIHTNHVDVRNNPAFFKHAFENYSPDSHTTAYRFEDKKQYKFIMEYLDRHIDG